MKKAILILTLILGGLFIGSSTKPIIKDVGCSTITASDMGKYFCYWEMCRDCYYHWNECSIDPPKYCPYCHHRSAIWIGYILINCTTPGWYPNTQQYCKW